MVAYILGCSTMLIVGYIGGWLQHCALTRR